MPRGPPPVLEVRPQAALRLLLEGVLRHSAECIEGLGDARHHQALLRGLQALTGLAEIPPGKVDELSDLHHKLMGAGPCGPALVRSHGRAERIRTSGLLTPSQAR